MPPLVAPDPPITRPRGAGTGSGRSRVSDSAYHQLCSGPTHAFSSVPSNSGGKDSTLPKVCPASSSSTRRAGSCDSRAATTAPDVPPPTTMTSNSWSVTVSSSAWQPRVISPGQPRRVPGEDQPGDEPVVGQPDGGEAGPDRLAELGRRGPLPAPAARAADDVGLAGARSVRQPVRPVGQELRDRRPPGDLEAAGEVGQHGVLGQALIQSGSRVKRGPEILGL